MRNLRGISVLVALVLVVLNACSGAASPSPSAPAAASAGPASPSSAAASVAPSPSPTPPPNPDKVTVMLDFVPEALYAPLQWGIEKGYFKDAGIDLTVQPSTGSSLTLQQLETGKVQFIFADFARYVLERMQDKIKATAIYTYYKTPTVGIMSNFQINSPADMVGKTFGTVPFSAGRLQLPVVLNDNGVDSSKVTIQLMDFSVLYSTLFAGKIDAAEVGIPGDEDAFDKAKELGKTVYFTPLSAWGFQDYSKTLIASDDIIAQNPDLVRRLVGAIHKSLTNALASATDDEIYNSLKVMNQQATPTSAAEGWADVKKYINGTPGGFSDDVVQYDLTLDAAANNMSTALKPSDLYSTDFQP